jgi:8-oxo-dGTP pyrophosphatase MutT (NUDIX family)
MNDLVKMIEACARVWPDLDDQRREILAMIESAKSDGADPCGRSRLAGHITCSAVVKDPNTGKIALIKHKKLDRWLLPGGHIEATDTSLFDASRREAAEELGLDIASILSINGTIHKPNGWQLAWYGRNVPFDIDIHPIPANPAKGEPEHIHYDLRWLMSANLNAVTANQEEVTGWEAVSPEDLRLTERIRKHLSDTRIVFSPERSVDAAPASNLDEPNRS